MSRALTFFLYFGLIGTSALFGRIVQKEGSGIEDKTLLFSPTAEERISFPKMQGWLEDYTQAVRLSQEKGLPILIAFTGSDWCPWSLKLAIDVLSTSDFMQRLEKDIVLLWLDFPEDENVPVANQGLKEKYQISELPTLVLVHSSGEEITRMGYSPMLSQELASSLQKSLQGYSELKDKLEKTDLAALSGEILKEMYLKARNLGCNKFKDKILEAGVQIDQETFFLLEKYARLVESGKKKDKTAVAIREEIIERDPKNLLGSHFQLAILDFQWNLSKPKAKTDPKYAVRPLIEYATKFGKKDTENLWKIEMMIAQYFFSKNKTEDALEHAEASYSVAPDNAKSEIAQSIEYLKTQLTR